MIKHTLPSLGLITFAAIGFAQGLPAFEEVDVNSDGQISQEEAAAIEALDFTILDTDQDGLLSMEEYNAAQAE